MLLLLSILLLLMMTTIESEMLRGSDDETHLLVALRDEDVDAY